MYFVLVTKREKRACKRCEEQGVVVELSSRKRHRLRTLALQEEAPFWATYAKRT
jgi:hypothetical protein